MPLIPANAVEVEITTYGPKPFFGDYGVWTSQNQNIPESGGNYRPEGRPRTFSFGNLRHPLTLLGVGQDTEAITTGWAYDHARDDGYAIIHYFRPTLGSGGRDRQVIANPSPYVVVSGINTGIEETVTQIDRTTAPFPYDGSYVGTQVRLVWGCIAADNGRVWIGQKGTTAGNMMGYTRSGNRLTRASNLDHTFTFPEEILGYARLGDYALAYGATQFQIFNLGFGGGASAPFTPPERFSWAVYGSEYPAAFNQVGIVYPSTLVGFLPNPDPNVAAPLIAWESKQRTVCIYDQQMIVEIPEILTPFRDYSLGPSGGVPFAAATGSVPVRSKAVVKRTSFNRNVTERTFNEFSRLRESRPAETLVAVETAASSVPEGVWRGQISVADYQLTRYRIVGGSIEGELATLLLEVQ